MNRYGIRMATFVVLKNMYFVGSVRILCVLYGIGMDRYRIRTDIF